LAVDQFQDYAPNGLQVEGKPDIQRIVFGVTASQALIDQAIERQADAILVHHGYFWKNEPPVLTGMKYQRIKKLIQNDINLLAYHLPLDAHDEFGNNAQLGRLWGLTELPTPAGLVRLGELPESVSIEQWIARVAASLQREPLHLSGGTSQVKRIAWCSGGAQGYIHQAIEMGADVFISGEVSEQTTHIAREEGIHYLAAGHHATETWGVKALAQHLQQTFRLDCEFIDIPNPV
jgi:dinuclear metal center YbgI/SA1388 family protein